MSDRSLTPESLLLHAGFVRGLARELVSDDLEAEDVVQETWVAALERPPRQRDSVRAWLAIVVRNFARKARRTDLRRRRWESAAARRDTLPSVADAVERESVMRSVVDAVFALDDPYRSAILMRYYQNLMPREIAARLDVSVATVNSRIQRGIAVLRARLDREHGRSSWCLSLAALAGLRPSSGAAGVATGTKVALATSLAVVVTGIGLYWTIPRKPATEVVDAEASTAMSRDVNEATRTNDPPPASTVADVPSPAAAKGSSPAELPIDAPTGSLLIRVLWSDGTPADGIHASIRPEKSTWPSATIETTSTPDGVVYVANVPAGTISFEVFEGGGGWAPEVKPGETCTGDVRIPTGITVEGIVVDERGDPVAGAGIWLSPVYDNSRGCVVTTADAAGAFHLRAVASNQSVGARADGFASSNLREIKEQNGKSRTMRIVLPGKAGSVSGRVRDRRGNPVTDAVVLVGDEYGRGLGFPDGEPETAEPPRRGRTLADGSFVVEDATPGTRPLAVRALRFAPWTGTVDVVASEQTSADVVLEPEGIIEGIVTDDSGSPVADATIETCGRGEMFACATRTGADGRYRLHGFATGKSLLQLNKPGQGRLQETISTRANSTVIWNPVLAMGLTVSGRVVDEEGQPIQGWYVDLTRLEGQDQIGLGSMATTQADGSFLFTNRSDVRHRLSVRMPDCRTPVLVVPDVRPSVTGLTIRVPSDRRPSAWVTGNVLDSGGAPVCGARVYVWHVNTWILPEAATDETSGSFRVGPLPPGRYLLEVQYEKLARARFGTFDLHADETVDFGARTLEVPGSVVVEPPPRHEGENRTPYVALIQMIENDKPTLFSTSLEASRRFTLLPGRYSISRRDGTWTDYPFEIRSGEETRLQLP